MKIAVEIPDVIYKKLINGEIHFGGITSKNIFNYVKNGTPIELPEKAEENGDAISRKAVIEHYSTGEISRCHHISRNNLLDFIEQLPPLNSTQEPYEDAISRNAMLEIEEASKSNWNSVLFKNVNELPSVTRQKINKILKNIRLDIALQTIPSDSDEYDYEAKWLNMGLRIALKVIDKYKAEIEVK